jgi:hypothetical protein
VKKKPWLGYASLAMTIIAAYSTGAYIATKYVSPCVCLVVQKVGTLN